MKKKGRGLSFDEKKDRMLKIFHDSKTVFNYEEIQKLSIKAGIPFPNVKEVLTHLKADSLIECEKIGAGMFYWSFPSKALQIFESKVTSSSKQIEFYQQQLIKIAQQMEEAIQGRQLTTERSQLQETYNSLCQQQNLLRKQISKYIRFDPQRIELLKKQNRQLKQAINSETDNLQQIKKFIKKQQPGTKDQDIEEQYEIPTGLDYID